MRGFSALELIKIQPELEKKKRVGYAQIKWSVYINVKIAPLVCVDMKENYIHTYMRHLR